MPIRNKRGQHLQKAREAQKKKGNNTVPECLIARMGDESEEDLLMGPDPQFLNYGIGPSSDTDTGSSSDSEEVELTDDEPEESNFDQTAFTQSLAICSNHQTSAHTFPYQRSTELSIRTQQRIRKKERELQAAAKGYRPLDRGFLTSEPVSDEVVQLPTADRLRATEQLEAIGALEKMLKSKTHQLQGQNLTRHMSVLSFLKMQQSKKANETRLDMALYMARGYGKGVYFSRKLITWELQWIRNREIEEGRRGCFAKSRSWFNDEGVQLAVRDWISGTGEDITAYKLSKAISDYLESKRAGQAVLENLSPNTSRIKARTARRWLKKMGFQYKKVSQGVYLDGHERSDVVEYRNNVFIPFWMRMKRNMVIFKEDGSWEIPSTLVPGSKPLVFITHDESTFHSNDGKRKIWMKEGHQPLRPKVKGKGIMVSGFLTPGGRLRVPDNITDQELMQDVMWPMKDGHPIRDSMIYLEFGKGNYWNGEKMVEHAMQIALPIFWVTFPGCQALFAFDNATNHSSYASDALVASRMNRYPGGEQPLMREGFIHSKQRPQSMVFAANHPDIRLRGKAKGIEQVLRERGLWKSQRPDGLAFLLQCPVDTNKRGCQPNMGGGCCARSVMATQKDFQQQKGRLQEELEASGQIVIFYPKFHCELNFIEMYWCAAKHYARENCQYSINGLRQTLPSALDSVSSMSIHRFYLHCMRILETYIEGLRYGTPAFKQHVYKGHRQVVDKSKW